MSCGHALAESTGCSMRGKVGLRWHRWLAPFMAQPGKEATPLNSPHSLLFRLHADAHGTSAQAAVSKKPCGLRAKPTCSEGIMGASSMRTAWFTPKTCHKTTSSPSRLLSIAESQMMCVPSSEVQSDKRLEHDGRCTTVGVRWLEHGASADLAHSSTSLHKNTCRPQSTRPAHRGSTAVAGWESRRRGIAPPAGRA